ncbi:MAG TPA: nickel pincer cofactor biosynthesis protein LarC [Syntrophales bacterium]|nr:nickel pincer cofactor biosynthesis protein LarC [Syntrophales bacterium]
MNPPEEKILYFDCFSGISGDMAVAALLDLGVDAGELRRELGKLALPGYGVEIRSGARKGIRCTEFIVNSLGEEHRHRRLDDILAIIEQSGLAAPVQDLSRRIFTVLAAAEAAVHGQEVGAVHFHEVGAVDSIVDIVGFAVCLTALQPARIVASPVNLGSGTVRCAHGLLPVPAPAVAELARGIPVYAAETPRRELATPTGMAILKAVCGEYGPLPELVAERVGYGAGRADHDLPNVLRVWYGSPRQAASGERTAAADEVLVLETNIDDMSPELYGHVFEKLLEAGALDVYLTNILMKKGRPGQMLSVIGAREDEEALAAVLFRETSTLGIRKTVRQRRTLARRTVRIPTPYGEMRVKVAVRDGKTITGSPEYEDCRAAALRTGKPLREIFAVVSRLAAAALDKEQGG